MRRLPFLGLFLLSCLVACGGGSGASAPGSTGTGTDGAGATRLVYTNNPAATAADWRLEVDPATNRTGTLLLKVLGPTGQSVQGATLFLSCGGTRSAWTKPAGANDPYALPGGLDLVNGGQDAAVPLFRSRLSGGDLQVGAYQKTGSFTLAADRPLFSVALGLKSGVAAGSENLALTSGRVSIFLESGVEKTLPLKVGTLIAE